MGTSVTEEKGNEQKLGSEGSPRPSYDYDKCPPQCAPQIADENPHSATHREKSSAIDSVTSQLLFLGGPWAPAFNTTLAVLSFLSYIPMKRLT